MEKKFYTVSEAANYLRISRQTVYRLVESGKLHSTQIGVRRTLIPASALERLTEHGVEEEEDTNAEDAS